MPVTFLLCAIEPPPDEWGCFFNFEIVFGIVETVAVYYKLDLNKIPQSLSKCLVNTVFIQVITTKCVR